MLKRHDMTDWWQLLCLALSFLTFDHLLISDTVSKYVLPVCVIDMGVF